MFRITLILLSLMTFTFSSYGLANALRWSDLIQSHSYKIDRKLQFFYNDQTYDIEEEEVLKLRSLKAMPMIDVYLAQFEIQKCKRLNFTSEMILESIEQEAGVPPISVSANVAPNCLLEVFLERNDFNRFSFFR